MLRRRLAATATGTAADLPAPHRAPVRWLVRWHRYRLGGPHEHGLRQGVPAADPAVRSGDNDQAPAWDFDLAAVDGDQDDGVRDLVEVENNLFRLSYAHFAPLGVAGATSWKAKAPRSCGVGGSCCADWAGLAEPA